MFPKAVNVSFHMNKSPKLNILLPRNNTPFSYISRIYLLELKYILKTCLYLLVALEGGVRWWGARGTQRINNDDKFLHVMNK